MPLDTLAKQYVPALNQEYRYWNSRKILEFDDGTEYTLREAVIIAQGKPKDEDLCAIHLVKQVFDGVVMTEKEIVEFLLFKEGLGKNGLDVASAVPCHSDRGVSGKKAADGRVRRGNIKTAGEKNGPESVQMLLDLP